MITIKYITPTDTGESDVFNSIRDKKAVTLMGIKRMKPEDVKRLIDKVKRISLANDCRIFALDDKLFLITPPTIEIPSATRKQAKTAEDDEIDDFDYPEERIPRKSYAQKIKPLIIALRESAERVKMPSGEQIAKFLDYKVITSAPKNTKAEDLEELKRLVMGKQASAKISYPAFNFEGMRIASRRRRIIREMATLKDLANDGKINKKTFEKVRKQLAEELETGEEPLQKGKGR